MFFTLLSTFLKYAVNCVITLALQAPASHLVGFAHVFSEWKSNPVWNRPLRSAAVNEDCRGCVFHVYDLPRSMDPGHTRALFNGGDVSERGSTPWPRIATGELTIALGHWVRPTPKENPFYTSRNHTPTLTTSKVQTAQMLLIKYIYRWQWIYFSKSFLLHSLQK